MTKVDVLMQSSLPGSGTAFIAIEVAVRSTLRVAMPLATARTFHGVEYEHHWRCQVADYLFAVTKPTKKFDLDLISKNIDGGLHGTVAT